MPAFQPVSPTWFVDSAAYGEASDLHVSLAEMLARVRATLHDIGTARLDARSGRPRPLVAVPTLGVRGGGFGDVRGDVVAGLLAVCEEAVAAEGIDVVIVAATPSDHSAFQARRRARGARHRFHLGEEVVAHAKSVADRVRDGSLALFLGAGVSMSAGLPSWSGLIRELAGDGADGLVKAIGSPLDQSELLRRRLKADLGEGVAKITQRSTRYGLNHALLASFACEQAVTTNYDDLYERAMQDCGRPTLPVLPFDSTAPHAPWLLKLHGDARRPETIVLSRSDFVGFDGRSRPLGAVVQALLLTKHLLVVGASMTDDNFLRLAHEVVALKEAGGASSDGQDSHVLGTVLTLRHEAIKEELWEGRFDYIAVSAQNHGGGALARRLAIFLDAVAMFASPPAHLADVRYAYLLRDDKPAQAVAEAARELRVLIHRLPAGAGSWAALDKALGDVGA